MSEIEKTNQLIINAVEVCRRLQTWCKDHHLSEIVLLKHFPMFPNQVEIDIGFVHVWTKWDYEDSQGPQPTFEKCVENYRKQSQQKIDEIQRRMDKVKVEI